MNDGIFLAKNMKIGRGKNLEIINAHPQ